MTPPQVPRKWLWRACCEGARSSAPSQRRELLLHAPFVPTSQALLARAGAHVAERLLGFAVPPLPDEHIEVVSLSPMAERPAQPTFDELGMTRDVTASGIRLRVVEHGSGTNLVLLHSLFMDHSTWSAVAAELCSEYRVITPDLPGYGESEKPAPGRFAYDIAAFTSAVADLYAALSLGRATVVGHGLGGAVAMTLAARHPELVDKLVVVDPLAESAAPWVYGRLAHLPLAGSLVFKQLLGRSLFGAYFRELFLANPQAISNSRLDNYYQSFNEPAARGSALATLRATVDTRPVAAQTSRIQKPTLILWGRRDRLLPPSVGQRLAREIRGARFELLDAGHAPQEERPRELSEALRRFLREAR